MPQWVTELGIPCFRPHVRRDDKGKFLYEVTAADLSEVIKNSAKFTVELHGNKPPITEGHRDFSQAAKESNQPLVLGYLENFRAGNLPDGTQCILCDRHYMEQYGEIAKRHPYASVDYIPGRKAIVGQAKLTRPPALNLGAVFYPGTNEPVYVYSLGADQMDPEKKDIKEETVTPDLTPEEQNGSEKVYRYLCSKYKWMGAAAQKYDAEASATNTGPAETSDKDPEKESAKPNKEPDDEGKEKDKVEKMAANELVQKYEADRAADRAELARLRKEREEDKVNGILDRLEKIEGYQFDRADEIAAMIPLDAAGRTKRAESIRKHNKQTPVPAGMQIEVYSGNVNGPPEGTTQKQAQAAIKYAEQHKTDYADALAAVKAGKI